GKIPLKKRIICILLIFCVISSISAPVFALGTGSDGAMKISEEGVRFIEGFEGFSKYEYADSTRWYIGYGTSCSKGDYPDGISEEDAGNLLLKALQQYEDSVNGFLSKYNIPATQCQFDALVSFTYNLGTGWMDPSNRITGCLINGVKNYTDLDIVNAFGIWCHSEGNISDLLVKRRMAEAKLFLYGDYGSSSSNDYSYLSFDADGGSTDYSMVFFEQGKPYGKLPEAKKDGYTFAGWSTDAGKKISTEDTAGEDMPVFAQWDADGGTPVSSRFSDVTEKDWFYSYVTGLSDNGVIAGYPDGTFRANNSVSCGEALKLILLAAGYSQQKPTGSHWASGYLNFAINKGLVGVKDISDLNCAATRLLIAKIAEKALKLPAADINTPFADTSDGYVLSLYKAGIIEGSKNDSGALLYKPGNGIIRAEISAIIWRIKNAETETAKTPQIQYGSYSVDVLQNVPVASYDSGCFHMIGGVMKYDSPEIETCNGIDVSEHQGKIDWRKVRASGVEFAIIRLGYRGYTEGGIYEDRNFETNIKGAQEAGLKVGVYFFSQAITVKEAQEEADFVLARVKGYDISFPVVFDWEPLGKTSARTYGLDTDTLCGCADTFCSEMADAGYKPMIYFNSYAGYIKYDLSRVLKYEFWFAQYSATPSFYYDYQMWQYTSSGKVDGITGNVDMNIYFSGKSSPARDL
ncbi:MAG: GH25 family lysozyme, partial [Bacillota bacterium]|nr:GH25 family lysozyme [Bacillota bacterium]